MNALQLAECLEACSVEAAAELRRLHAINAELVEALQETFDMLGNTLLRDTFGYEWLEKSIAALEKAKQ